MFAGRYELEEKVGSGSFGTVYSALDTKSKRQKRVAVKILQAQLDPSSPDFQRFQREGVAMSKIQHPNAVSVSDFGVSSEGNAYLVMELLEGKTLSQILRDVGRIPALKAMRVLLPICSVLSKAHAVGMLHRDIKTENIFIHRKGSQEIVKLLDFGIARIVANHRLSNNLTMEEIEFGTPAYMAPERFKNEPYDSKIDVYSLGVVFYELVCGRLPFIPHDNSPMSMAMMHLQARPVPPQELAPAISPRLNGLILKILSKDPRQRPSVDMIAQEIAHMVGVDIDMYTYLTPGSHQVHESFYEDLATSLRRLAEERFRSEVR
jgi:serine/threonine protein kinase